MTLTASERSIMAEARAIKARERKAAKRARPKATLPTASDQRQPRKRDPAYLAWLRRQPCSVGPVGCSGPVEAAHIRYGRPGERPTGLGRKPDDARAVPLCAAHHRIGPDAQHSRNEAAWWRDHGIDPHALADRFYATFREAA